MLVLRHDDCSDLFGVAPDQIIGCGSKPAIVDVLSIMACARELTREGPWQLRVDEEAQSGHAQDDVIAFTRRIFECRRDVLRLQ